eukprot:8463973-Pyramimonas_sp.AAC.1
MPPKAGHCRRSQDHSTEAAGQTARSNSGRTTSYTSPKAATQSSDTSADILSGAKQMATTSKKCLVARVVPPSPS